MAEPSSNTNVTGTPTPGSPTSREARYAARSSRVVQDVPTVDNLLSTLELNPTQAPTPDLTPQGGDIQHGGQGTTVDPAVPSQRTTTPPGAPRSTAAGGLTVHQAALARRAQLLLQLEESEALINSLDSAAPMTTPVQPSLQPQPVPGAPTHTVPGAPTHTPTTTGMTSPPILPTPAESMLPSVMPFELIDWEFLNVTLQCMRSTRGTSVADVSMAAHRLWGMFPPGSNPTVAIALLRAATGGVSADFINAANTLLLSLRHFHANTGRGHIWSTSEPIPDASAHTHPHPSSGSQPPVATLASNAPGPTSRLTPATTSLTASTTTAASGTPTPATAVAASTGPMTEAERRSVRRAYTAVDLRKVDPLPRFPFPANVDIAISLGQFIATCNLVLGEILVLCDDSEKQSFDRPPWVVGWDAPLQKCFRKALSAPQVMISPLPRLIDDFFIQLRRELDVDDSGPSAYRKLLSLLTAHFDDGDQGRAFEQLHSFGVPDLTEFSAFLRAFKQRVSIVQGTERLFKPSDAMVIEIVRGVVSRQYPSLMPTLYPGRLMTIPEPFHTVSEMWAAFEVLATNKTPAVNGSRFRAISSGGHVSYTSSPSASTQQAHSHGSGSHAQGTPLNPLVMHVANNDADPFRKDDPDWPLRHYEEVYMVTTTFSTQDPPLLTPLLTTAARAQALRAHGGHCLNCNGTDHSVKTCAQDFLNTSGILNPALGQLNDGGRAYRQWQQRMRTYRRGQYERHVERNSIRHNQGHNNRTNNARHLRRNNGRSDNGRHRHGRSYGSGHQQSPGQLPRIEAAATTPAPATPSTALTVHSGTTTPAPAPAPPANMRIGQASSNNPNHRQPGTFRTN